MCIDQALMQAVIFLYFSYCSNACVTTFIAQEAYILIYLGSASFQ